jgi:hypothetical protein
MAQDKAGRPSRREKPLPRFGKGLWLCGFAVNGRDFVEVALAQLGRPIGAKQPTPDDNWCRTFAANAVRLQLHALAYNLGNFLRTLATPEPIKDWSLTSLKEKLIKIGAKVVSHGRYVAFQMAEVAIPRNLFADILRMIAELRSPPVTSTA